MKRVVMGLIAACALASAHAQVRCRMPNGIWIDQRLASYCPAGAEEAQTLDGRPLPLRPPVEYVPPKKAVESNRQSMPFDACVKLMVQTVVDVGGSNTRVTMARPDIRMLRICTNDGSVLMTCSREDNLMVTTKSPHRCD